MVNGYHAFNLKPLRIDHRQNRAFFYNLIVIPRFIIICEAINTSPSHKRTLPGNGPAHDEGVDLFGTLVGVDRFGIGYKSGHIVFKQNAVAAQNLSCFLYNAPGVSGTGYLGQRGLLVGHLAEQGEAAEALGQVVGGHRFLLVSMEVSTVPAWRWRGPPRGWPG